MNWKPLDDGHDALKQLLTRHFDDPTAAITRLDAYLQELQLPFSVVDELRDLPADHHAVLPPFVHYLVPGSRRGVDQKKHSDPLHESYLNRCDGIGQNWGCPVRLLRALDAMARLPDNDQVDPRKMLQDPTQHLVAVEELLWATGWKKPCRLQRGFKLENIAGLVDWCLEVKGQRIFLEAKFRRSDWPRLTDTDPGLVVGEGFLSRAGHKFPTTRATKTLHLVGITLFDNIDHEVADIIGSELEGLPQIDAVVVRSLAQMTTILSLKPGIPKQVRRLLVTPKIKDYPINYGVVFDRGERAQRDTARSQEQRTVGASKVRFEEIMPE